MSADVAINVLWAVWYVTWIVALAWSSRTKRQMRSDMGGAHRLLAGLGAMLLFIPASSSGSAAKTPVVGELFHVLWRKPDWADWSLFALAAAAFAFCWWARLHLGRLWSGFVTLKEDHRIIDTGPYGLVRHPIYTGVIAAALATALIRSDLAALLGWAMLAWGLNLTARIEETFLRAQLGSAGYDAYAQRVPMLLPRVS